MKILFSKLAISEKFSSDVSWNIASFAIIGLSGISLNIAIAKFYGAAILGVFNQIYALFILLAQLAVGGIQLSVLKNIPEFSRDKEETNTIISAAVLATVTIAFTVVSIAFLIKDAVGFLLNSEGVRRGIVYTLPGIFFFSINTVFLAFHNGLRHMKAYAVFRALRFLLVLTIFSILIANSYHGYKIPVILSVSEFLLFIVLSIYSSKFFTLRISHQTFLWIKRHISHGFTAMFGNAICEINTRVDIIMLGIFASDALVGVYSFAAIFVEGFHELVAVFKANVNPLLTQYRVHRGDEALRAIVRKGRKITYKFMVPFGVLLIFLFPALIHAFRFSPTFFQGWYAFAILMFGTLIIVGYLPFQMLLNQIGFPGYQTLFFSSTFLTNIVLNLLLIPRFGIYGAAIATSCAFISQILYLKIYTYSATKIRI